MIVLPTEYSADLAPVEDPKSLIRYDGPLVERALDVCGQHYAAITSTGSDQMNQELVHELVNVALQTVHLAERETYPQAMETYLHEHRAQLERLWRRYGPCAMFEGEFVLIDLPGCFVLCERTDEVPRWLKRGWAEQDPGGNRAGTASRQLAVRHK
ncbi:hypothetical protein [Streptomyces prunicolor]|uniref:Uncharacterized protein n=1 Tax=Streptomyces prunicolor TaxID=67348 RepID=A0ABU4FIY1_9ACTN|nr:hypothetical protein [Streptomyces prunicolor]MDV7220527.1 hypothetical protein [Streptomyces prunicolor]